MKEYTSSQIDLLFEKIWSIWPNQERGEKAGRKALKVTLDSGEDYDKIYKACRAYSLEHSGDEFTYQINNFLLQDHWKDLYDTVDIELLSQKRKEALELCKLWNEKCLPHWCKISDIEARIPIARKALSNKYFKENYKISLDKASRIFKYQFRDNDYRSKIILSFTWFTNVSPDKFTVLKIIEGEYGKESFETEVKRKEIKIRKITDEERKESLKLFKEIFRQEHNKGDPGEGSGKDSFPFEL